MPTAEGGPIDADLARALAARFADQVRFDEPLARYASLRVGGPADALVRAESRADLVDAARLCRDHGVRPFWLGAGFNTLFRDGGLRGVVVRAGSRGTERAGEDELCAQAGTSHTRITRAAAEAGLAGLEFAVGIPGTLGGWIAMNAGTREREMADVLRFVEWIDAAGEVRRRERAELHFAYRRGPLPEGACALAAGFALRPDDPERIRARMNEQLAARRAAQPVDQPSCGSVFRNPEGEHAGRLIEAAGLKGAQVGGARISDLHANFITTAPGATARDVLDLIEQARERVAAHAGVELVCEVHIAGVEA